jgi:N-methylhydantoinase A/oxoprolinase/acetone carboxylase beta subunit
MSWRYRIETGAGVTTITARDLSGGRHVASVAEGAPPRLTHFGDGPHHPCRMAEALGIGACLIAPPEALSLRPEITAHREAPVGAALNWRTRLQAAAELDRLSGVVFDEIVARGASPGEIGLAPVLHLRIAGDAATTPVRLGTEDEMRAALAEARCGAGAVDAPVMIEAMAITAYGPGDSEVGAPTPIPAGLRRLDISDGPAAGPGVLITPDGAFVIDRGWSVAPALDAVARLFRN